MAEVQGVTITLNEPAKAELARRYGAQPGLAEHTELFTRLLLTEMAEFCIRPDVFSKFKAHIDADETLTGTGRLLLRMVEPVAVEQLRDLLTGGAADG